MAAKKKKAAVALPDVALRDMEDDAQRLVLADDLQQRGDPRGELIVVQCELARLPEIANRRRTELQLRSDTLVGRYRNRWLEHLPLTDKEKSTVTFRRGFPLGVSLTVDRFLRVGEQLLEQSSFSELGLTALGSLGSVKPTSLGRVRRLDLQPTPGVSRTGPRYVEGTQVKALRSELLCERLRTFVASGCSLSYAMGTLARAAGLQAIETLDLSTTYIGDEYLESVCVEGNLPRLRSLAVGGNRLTARSAEAIAKRRWPLETLSFGFGLAMNDRYGTAGQLETKGLEVLCSGAFMNLRSLAVENQQVDEAGAGALANARFDRLESLSIAGNMIGSDGLRTLAASPVLGSLASFDASLNPVHEGLEALASAAMPKLVSLRLAATETTDAELARLCQAPWLPNLVELDLSDNPAITDDGAAALASTPRGKLAFLALRNTDISARAAKKIEDAHDLIVFDR